MRSDKQILKIIEKMKSCHSTSRLIKACVELKDCVILEERENMNEELLAIGNAMELIMAMDRKGMAARDIAVLVAGILSEVF